MDCYSFHGRVRYGNGTVQVEVRGGGRGGSIVGGQVVAAVAIDIHRLGSAETDRTLRGIAANLEMEPHLRQSLLVTETAATRLFDLIPILKQGNEDLRERIAKQNPFQGPRLN